MNNQDRRIDSNVSDLDGGYFYHMGPLTDIVSQLLTKLNNLLIVNIFSSKSNLSVKISSRWIFFIGV
eukprot:snap_masked-scaffold_83-processed-gene-0.27-mRNA-1 protein AED:1.00 eAED:1.00 QI:0/0/0/0/1/1/2/0/66